MLKNTAYLNELPSEGVAQLVDGVYREKYMPDSATEMVISLADIHFGDLNGDGVDDVLVILISYPGGRREPNHLGGGTRARGYRRAGESDFCHRQTAALMIQ